MATMLDHQVGWGKESAYGTPATVSRFGEWLPKSGIEWDPNIVQGEGLRVGSSVARAGRRVALVGKGKGKLQFELASKGLGNMLEACWGTGVSTLVSGTTYQELFTPVTTTGYLPSLTIQEGIVQAGGAVDAYTYAGCTIKSFDLEQGDKLLTLQTEIDAHSLATATALATASYPTTPTLYSAGLPASGALTLGGTMTVPTTTALGSIAIGANAAIKKWTLSVDNGIDEKRDRIGDRGQPTAGLREIKIKTEIEYDSVTGTVLRDAYIGQTRTPLLVTSTTAEALSTGVATMQLALPACYIDSGAIPQPSEGEVVTTELEWSVLDDLISVPAYMVMRTADTAL